VVAPVVIRELDKHKDQHKLGTVRDRAKEALKKVEAAITGTGGCGLPQGVLLTHADEPVLAFAEYGLNTDVPDDHLLACCVERKQEQSSMDVVVLTNDIGPRLKATKLAIRSVEPPEKIKLQPVLDG